MSDLSRRNFMTAAAAAAVPMLWNPAGVRAAALVSDPAFEFAFDPNAKKVRLAWIGLGGRGSALLRELTKAGQSELVLLSDIDEAARGRAKEITGAEPEFVADYREVLKRDDYDAVVIATPVDLHCEMAVAACEAGKNIYCEKPLGLNAKEAERIFEAAEENEKKNGKIFQVGFQWVYNASFRAAIDAVHEGVIGDVRFVHAQRHGGDLPKGKSWLFERERSGDIIVEQAVHEMNIFCWGLKSAPTRACGLGGTNVYVNDPPGRTIMDHYSLTYEFPGPVRVSYSHLYYAQAPLAQTHIWFYGTKGAVDVMGGQIYMADGSTPPAREMKLTKEDTYNALVAFINSVRTGSHPDADAAKGLVATNMGVLGRTAIYKERVVNYDDIK